MKLLIYSHFFAPSIGGVENIVLSLARGLADRRTPGRVPEFDATLVTETPASGFDDAALPFHIVRQPGAWRLASLIRRADVVHLAGPALLPMLLALTQRKPYVIEHHGYQAVCPNGLLLFQPDYSICPGHFLARRYRECLRCNAAGASWWHSLRQLLLTFVRRALCRRSAANLAVSQHVLERSALPFSSVVYHGIADPLEGAVGNLPPPADGRPLCFAYVGRLVSEKGVSVILEAARGLRNDGCSFELRLIGDGPERSRLETLIEQYGLQSAVRITGFLTGGELRECLHDAQVVVMPSVWEETAGLAAMEQMMCGRLVIASSVGGLAEVVADAGLTVPPGDPITLAACMRRVTDQPALVEILGTQARERALRLFERRRMIEEHATIYRRVCACPDVKGS